jgi:cation:H+ antiporter
MVALGTSLPELATALIAAARRHSDVAVGAVVGSNIFNVLSILGLTAIVKPIPFSEQIASFDVWIMLGSSALLVPLLLGRGRIGRLAGALLLGGYASYIWYVY